MQRYILQTMFLFALPFFFPGSINAKEIKNPFELTSDFYITATKEITTSLVVKSKQSIYFFTPLFNDSIRIVSQIGSGYLSMYEDALESAKIASELSWKGIYALGSFTVSGLEQSASSFVYSKHLLSDTLQGVEDWSYQTGQQIGVFIASKKTNTNFLSKKEIHLSASVAGLWNTLIDKVSDPLVPLFWNSPVVPYVSKETKTITPISSNVISDGVPSGQTEHNQVSYTYVANYDNSNLLGLRLEFLTLTKNLLDYVDQKRIRQAEKTGDSISNSTDEIDNSTITNSSFSGTANLSELTVDTDTLVVDEVNHRVGISTDSPDYKLDVAGDVNFTGTLYQNGVAFVGGGSSQWTTTGSNIYYTTGNIGIGTTTPSSLLSVAGDINLTGALRTNNNAGTTGMVLQTTGTGVQWVATSSLGISGGGSPNYLVLENGGLATATSTDYLKAAYFTATSTTATSTFAGGLTAASGLYVLQNGKVGIGSSAPTTLLHLKDGSVSADTVLKIERAAGTYGLELRANHSGGDSFIRTLAGNGTTAGDLYLQTYNGSSYNDSLFLSTGGNVGIGTTTPRSTLDVNGNLSLDYATAGDGITGYNNTTGNHVISLTRQNDVQNASLQIAAFGGIGFTAGSVTAGPTSAGSALFIRDNGNIGISTTTPGYKLSVAGDINLTGALRTNNNAGTTGMVLQTTGTGVQWVATSTLGISGSGSGVVDSGLAGQIAFYSANGTTVAATSTVFVVDGKVGIGTTTPSAILDVGGASLFDSVESRTTLKGQSIDTTSGLIYSGGTIVGNLNKTSNLNSFGIDAGYNATIATHSNFFGNGAGKEATSASNSNFFGYEAGYFATDAVHSNFLGFNSGVNATYAADSNFLGYQSGSDATSASHSNFLGYQSGMGASSASDSNFLGYTAGYYATNVSHSNFFGNSAGYIASDASNSNFFGQNAGYGASSASDSNFFGYQSGYNASSASRSNFIGYNAGYDATSAQFSNFIGQNAGNGATNAQFSNFIGYDAGVSASNALNSIFIGRDAGKNDTVDNFIGSKSSILIGNYTSTGGFSNSIAIGQGVSNSTTEQFNIGNVLYASGISSSITPSATPMSNGKVGIGTNDPQVQLQVAANSSNPTFRINTVSSTSFDPTIELFRANGATNIGSRLWLDNSAGDLYLDNLWNNDSGDIYIRTKTSGTPVDALSILGIGNIGIGTTSPYAKLSVVGQVVGEYFTATSTTLGFQAANLLGGATNVTVDANGNIIRDPSDARLKENIEAIADPLGKIEALRGVTYYWKDKDRFGDSQEIGMIAQEVEQVVPQVVSSGGEYKSLNIKNLVALLIEGVKALKQKLDTIAVWFIDDKFSVQGEVCVDEVCVSKEQFKSLLLNSGGNQTNEVSEGGEASVEEGPLETNEGSSSTETPSPEENSEPIDSSEPVISPEEVQVETDTSEVEVPVEAPEASEAPVEVVEENNVLEE